MDWWVSAAPEGEEPREEQPPADLAELGRRVEQIRRSVQEVQAVLLLALAQLSQRPPLRVEVEHLEVQELSFHLDAIDVKELSGELNIGITSSMKAGNRTLQIQAQPPEGGKPGPPLGGEKPPEGPKPEEPKPEEPKPPEDGRKPPEEPKEG